MPVRPPLIDASHTRDNRGAARLRIIGVVGAGVMDGAVLVVEAMTLFLPSVATAVRLYVPATEGCHWNW